MFKVIKLKSLIIGLLMIIISIALSVGIVAIAESKSIPKPIYTIVIDAGHGGRDDGCEGVTGTKESVINLQIAKTLKSYLETLGIRVVMTRLDGNGLYSANATNYKQSDMAKRIEIITNASPDMVISIHCNSYKDSTQAGAQAFFQENDEKSKAFAENVQSQLISILSSPRLESIAGDYYILKESKTPAIIVECGYLTNPEEEQLLKTTDYQNKVAYTIMCGVVKHFELCGND